MFPIPQVPLLTLSGHVEGVSSAVWLSETEVCTASWDHSIRLWDVAQGQHKSTIVRNTLEMQNIESNNRNFAVKIFKYISFKEKQMCFDTNFSEVCT